MLMIRVIVVVAAIALTTGCATTAPQVSGPALPVNADKLLVVDCLLPGTVRRLGKSMTYLSPRRPIKTTALDCEVRGGEYVAFDRADYRTALNVWLAGAQAGDARAQTYVGEIYEKGMGIAADYAMAYAWYKKAADQNYARAQINLGYLFEKGLGVQKDTAQALNWYRKASGLDGEELQFASTVEVEVASRFQEQIGQLKKEIERRKGESEMLRHQLKRTQDKLKLRKRALNAAEAKTAALRRDLEQARTTRSGTASVDTLQSKLSLQQGEVKRYRDDISWLESELEQQQAGLARELSAVTQQKGTLQQQLAQQREQIADLQAELENKQDGSAPRVLLVAGPTIEILDPPLVLTRGLPSIKMRSAAKERVVVGRVTAPAGVLTMTINDQPQRIESNGMFRAVIPVQQFDTSVRVVAVDKEGQRAALDFTLLPKFRGGSVASKAPFDAAPTRRVRAIDFGAYYALIIGNDRYPQMPDLSTPVNDAETVEKVLRERYGFKTQLLLNADRYTILSALNRLREQLTPRDNLVIYYAGHGEIDRVNMQGYWLPVDAEPNSTANWISNSSVTELLNAMTAKHVLVVADSCYSGTMTRSSVARLDVELTDRVRYKWLKVMARTRSRTALTSGGVKPVLDSGGGGHSIFARAFLDALRGDDDILEGFKVYREVFEPVQTMAAKYNIEQTPQYAPIRFGGHESGEFLFVPVGMRASRLLDSGVAISTETVAWPRLIPPAL